MLLEALNLSRQLSHHIINFTLHHVVMLSHGTVLVNLLGQVLQLCNVAEDTVLLPHNMVSTEELCWGLWVEVWQALMLLDDILSSSKHSNKIQSS